ncbi:MAG: creatininase family protein [Candidatus Abyssobacteria bacterium SURF_17]|uniref:Creatininase family protein n=1 Tax=Candidatus Abyssobacteria bacterium SURF_17 TaxID=2093361 RepID=A0A419F7F7_9BACT|nr:MAG: creatininase family protein [Candidatus Abyssubacteria bacterium SURF_17]
MNSNILKAEEMRYPQMRDLNRDKTLLILPVSSLEVHGHHLPMGMDTFFATLQAEDLAEAFAEAHPDWAVVLYPPLTLGTDELPLAGSVSATPRVVRDAVMGFGNSLVGHGFKYIVVTNGHGGPRQPPAIEEACHRISVKRRSVMIAPSMRVLYSYVTGDAIPRIEAEIGRPLTDIEKSALSTGGEHAAVLETSLLLAYRPELVSDVYKQCPYDTPPRVPSIGRIGRVLSAPFKVLGLANVAEKVNLIFDGLAGNIGWWMNTHRGYGDHVVTYMGNPSAASSELGMALRKLIARDLLEEVEAVISGRRLPSEVHSIFWTIPVARTDFFRNLGIAIGALIVIVGMLLLL